MPIADTARSSLQSPVGAQRAARLAAVASCPQRATTGGTSLALQRSSATAAAAAASAVVVAGGFQ